MQQQQLLQNAIFASDAVVEANQSEYQTCAIQNVVYSPCTTEMSGV
jgi:hypothetical protein